MALAGNSTKAIDEEIAHVLSEIKTKDALIRELNDERAELNIRYEELKALRLHSQSAALASERDWEKGTIICCNRALNTHNGYILVICRHIQLDDKSDEGIA